MDFISHTAGWLAEVLVAHTHMYVHVRAGRQACTRVCMSERGVEWGGRDLHQMVPRRADDGWADAEARETHFEMSAVI